jgi:hypothetical protein
MDKVVVKDKLFIFHNPSPNGIYQATLSADGNTLNGTWSEDTTVPLVFTRTAAAAAPTPEPIPTRMAARPPVALADLRAKTQSVCRVRAPTAGRWERRRASASPVRRSALW